MRDRLQLSTPSCIITILITRYTIYYGPYAAATTEVPKEENIYFNILLVIVIIIIDVSRRGRDPR